MFNPQKTLVALAMASTLLWAQPDAPQRTVRPYTIVDTGQTHCFNDSGQLRQLPQPGEPFFGQDAFYEGSPPDYRDNDDGTISDLNTGLMWQKTPDLDRKLTYGDALAAAKRLRLARHDDWRVPTIKELYSLIDFNGCVHARTPVPYIDTRFFDFRFGDQRFGERLIDAQYWSSTEYVGLTMHGHRTVFGVNFADGRIKGYPRDVGHGGRPMRQFVRFVRGNPRYGENGFVDNEDGTISDLATGLMWAKADRADAVNWQQALDHCENLELAGYDDWRLPNAKELHSIVDYTRAPDARKRSQRGPAIDPVFEITTPESWFWTSTTHLDGRILGQRAVYIAFGQATGFMPDHRTGARQQLNVHGAGAQRSDPKSGNPRSPEWAHGFGPQGDEIRIFNYARAVRSIDADSIRRAQPAATPLPIVLPGNPHQRHPPPAERRTLPLRGRGEEAV